MKDKNKKKKDLAKKLDDYLSNGQTTQQECEGEECLIKTDKSIVERMNKKIITQDGRQLLI